MDFHLASKAINSKKRASLGSLGIRMTFYLLDMLMG